MATVSANQTALQPRTPGPAGNCLVMFGTYTIAAALSANDLINLFTLPKNALVLGGWMITDDIDTGTEALQIDVGYTANGGASTASVTTNDGQVWTNAANSGSATGFLASGVLNGDAIVDIAPAGSNWRYFNGLKGGPKFFSEETLVQAKITAAANSGGTGTITVVALYQIV